MLVRSLAWAVLSVGGSLSVLTALLPIAGWFELPHAGELAMVITTWGGLSLAGVLLTGRLALGRWPEVTGAAATVGSIGVGIAAVLEYLLLEWTAARFGYADPDFVGWTAWLFVLLVALAMAVLAAMVAPPGATAVPRAGSIGIAGVTLTIIVLNVPGLGDGLDPDSWPLAIAVGLAGLYALVATIVALRRPARPASLPVPRSPAR